MKDRDTWRRVEKLIEFAYMDTNEAFRSIMLANSMATNVNPAIDAALATAVNNAMAYVNHVGDLLRLIREYNDPR